MKAREDQQRWKTRCDVIVEYELNNKTLTQEKVLKCQI